MIIQIDSGYFCAGLVYNKRVKEIAPIISYIKDWDLVKINEYCLKKFWTLIIIEEK